MGTNAKLIHEKHKIHIAELQSTVEYFDRQYNILQKAKIDIESGHVTDVIMESELNIPWLVDTEERKHINEILQFVSDNFLSDLGGAIHSSKIYSHRTVPTIME